MADTKIKAQIPSFELKGNEIILQGDWIAMNLGGISRSLRGKALLPALPKKETVINIDDVRALDTAGAWLIVRLFKILKENKKSPSLKTVNANHQKYIGELLKRDIIKPEYAEEKPWYNEFVCHVGMRTMDMAKSFCDVLAYLGKIAVLWTSTIGPKKELKWVSITYHIHQVGVRAIPIIGLISFLIGMVLAYQGIIQLEKFGAEIYSVDFLGISILREISVLLTAIIVAGRSGSAFTAQIGSMALNQEVDALTMLGLKPVATLVLPRLIALLISLPLLVFFSMIVAMIGGMIATILTIEITAEQFIHQFIDAIKLSTFWVGMSKSPIFAILIAMVGCFRGLQVRGSAESVGRMTTQSVVESLFLVIVADAVMSLIFSYLRV